jgi:hypothetical protein
MMNGTRGRNAKNRCNFNRIVAYPEEDSPVLLELGHDHLLVLLKVGDWSQGERERWRRIGQPVPPSRKEF